MLHNLIIMSGLGGIVLFRQTFTKVVNQPRLVAGVVAALCVKTRSGVGVPINTIELEAFTVTVVELALDDDAHGSGSEFLRAVLFHDNSDGDFYGHALGIQLLTTFKETFTERLRSMRLANVEGVEETFKAFASHIRPAVRNSVIPVMQTLENHEGVKQVFLLGHRGDGMFFKTVEHVWYSSSPAKGSSLISNVQALLTAGDDLLSSKHEASSKQDATAVVNIGSNIRIERLDIATLVVVTQPPHTCISCQQLITSCTNVVKNLFQLMRNLEGSSGMRT